MSMPGVRAAVALWGLLVAVSAFAAVPIPVTTCHQRIERGIGILMADLDCSADPPGVGVEVINGKLDLNGHSVTGAEIGVACVDRCTIFGPGTLSGNRSGVDAFATRPERGRATIKDATITGNAALGIGGYRVQVTNSTVSGNGGLVVEGNALGGGILARRRVFVRDSHVDGNFTHGVCSAERIAVTRSTVQGNGTGPGCDPDPSCLACGDIVSTTRPSVSRTSACDVSVNPPSASWGVCSSDP